MDVEIDDWKKNVGFPINYNSASSDDDFDIKDVVMRNPRASSILLEDIGDGAEADLLGTTPPRSRIRDKEKRRNCLDSGLCLQRIKEKKDVGDYTPPPDLAVTDRFRKRASLKLIRSKERDYKLDVSHQTKADSLPSPNPMPAVPTLVESCNRFMSLTSRPKSRAACDQDVEDTDTYRSELPASRVNFHKTFSMLINMGNVDKGCRRTISREEQVWQNELKDLIWLELQAKIAGRTLAQQDAYLCVQRKIVPTVVRNILEYRFINDSPCRRLVKKSVETQNSQDKVAEGQDESATDLDDDDITFGCLTFDCASCAGAVGRALKEIGTILDAFYNAVALYPSSTAMTVENPSIATPLFKNRNKAMCLWYNTALNMRLKIVSVRLLLRSIKEKTQRDLLQRGSLDSDISRQSSESHRCKVRFNLSTTHTPTDSSNSDSSYHKDDENTIKEAVKVEDAKEEDVKEECVKQKCPKEKEEEGDSGIESLRHTGQTTPEIVLEQQYSTTNSTHSHGRPGYCSIAPDTSSPDMDPFDLGSIEELTELRLLNKCTVSLYRQHHQEILKTRGVRRSMMFMNKMSEHVLQKVYLTLEKPGSVITENELEQPVEVFHDPKEEVAKTNLHIDESRTEELRRYGCWSEESRAMRLPSYRSHFLLLSCICMEAVHDYLSFRLEAKPERPSCLTIKQLMHELKEGLDIASEMRLNFVRNLRATLAGRGAGQAAADLLLLVNTFDSTVETGLELYLSYLTTMSEKEAMPRGALQTEWSFTARLARRIKCAHHIAPIIFSTIVCNQLNRLLKTYIEKFDSLTQDKTATETTRHGVYAKCRAAQNIFAEQREHTLQCAQWARALAARLARGGAAYLTQRQDIFNAVMSVRDFIVEQVQYILQQWRQVLAEEAARDVPEPVLGRVRELLLQTCKLAFQFHKELYKFVEPVRHEEVVPRSRPASLQLAPRPRPPPRRRPDTVLINESFNVTLAGIHKELHGYVHENNHVRRSITSDSPPRLRHKFVRSDSVIEDYDTAVFEDRLFDHIAHVGNQAHSSIELLLSGYTAREQSALKIPDGEDQVDYTAGVRTECGTDAARVASAEAAWATRVARAVIHFAKCWMRFVVERCDKGRGLRPRWASQGLEFLMLACDPCNTRHLTDEEFEELKQLMDGCISHVIGSRRADPGATPSPRPRHRLHSPFSPSPASKDSAPPAPPSPTTDEHSINFNEHETNDHQQRVLEAISQLEESRDSSLRSNKSVGRVVTSQASNYEMKLRQLTFKWQRGLKIGQGTFGKVYTVVNTESGQLLAMKELSMLANDRRAFQRAANELRVLEGVIHPHLVRYYGAELHREEMLIFMELCVEGSLEALVATSGALAEHTVRRYTKQLLSAVQALHSRSIVHRDIKSGNIFLTNEGHCLKLGDFGCAVKIRANTTAPNELQGFVGTQAYMAPEVFMESSGHGRAADIWSVGCVVTEMASGKRPFSEYDSNYQIMFRVGMGARPHVPRSLSEEGAAFCAACLTHDPALRPRAPDLLLHTFLMVNSDDDCKCEPAYLLTK